MELVTDSAEHHFLTTLDKLKGKPDGWYGIYFSLSKLTPHKSIVSDLDQIANKLQKAKEQQQAFVKDLSKSFDSSIKGYIYVFSDFDVLTLVKFENDDQKKTIQRAYKTMSGHLPDGLSDIGALSNSLYNYQKLSDTKLLSTQRHEAYLAMANTNKVGSIAARRSRRDEPLVMVVEDDRFTLHYASTVLSKEYDFVTARTGEDAITTYIEHAPDIVFLDIHLPGISGHEVMQAINAVDQEAFVVMLSVDTAKDSIVQASEFGAKKFLKKPFSKERMIGMVKNSPYVRALAQSKSTSSETMLH